MNLTLRPQSPAHNEPYHNTISPNNGDSESPVHQPSAYPTARARIDLNANWTRNSGLIFRTSGPSPPRNHYQAPHLHHRFSSPPRDPYLAPGPNSRARHTGTMGIPFNNIHQYVGTVEFVRREMEHRIRHDLLNQRIEDLANQIWCQEEKITTLEEDREILECHTETTRDEARFAIRVTLAVLVVVLICFLVESYLKS
ncbi:hypothetical protein L1987_54892 [Smallanthus sonchifolius]|uniref:Uncharacterized protein n=1 Tax=Smallanthus sonchifolius TaxID=185202 RepID=A0ACB9E919_9ASTR|nr:hypothetical protein L1987_54892 [Smallanthus sonchifolius]